MQTVQTVLPSQTGQTHNYIIRVVVTVIQALGPSRPATPNIAPAAGTYGAGQQIVLSDNTSGAVIHYTVDGSKPSSLSPAYSGPLTLSANEVVQAIAVSANGSSSVSSASYSVMPHLVFSTQPRSAVANTTLNPGPAVSIVDGNGAVLSDATNAITLSLGANPGDAVLSGTATVNAVHGVAQFPDLRISAGGNGYTLAAVSSGAAPAVSAAFDQSSPSLTLSLPNSPIVAGSVVSGTIALSQPAVQDVHLSLASSVANVASVSPSLITIPAGQSTIQFTLTSTGPGTSTLKASATSYVSGGAQITVVPAAPIILPGTGSYVSGQQITLTDVLPGAAIYYTTDGSVPTTASPLYSGPIALARAQVVNAIAVQNSLSSSVSSQAYQVLPVTMTLAPASATLSASQTQSFVASLTGLSDTRVTWSLSPAVGVISENGLYTAPASVPQVQTVLVSATSKADPTRVVTAKVFLVAPVSVSVSPGSVSLTSGQSQSFAAQVNGTTNAAVNWSLSPAVGSVSTSGVYTAPASVLSAQRVTLTASSVADPTKTATATLALLPPVSVFLTPVTTSLTPSQTQSFAATVTGSSNTGVTYALRPAVGTISASGLYTPPASVAVAQTVSVVATSVADSTKYATASIQLIPTPSLLISLPAPSANVGSTQTGSVTLSQPASAGGVTVALTSSSPSAAVPTSGSLTIAAGQSTGSFTYTAQAAGSAVFTAAANGYSPATAQVVVTPPAIPASLFGLTVLNFQNVTPGVQFGTTRSWDAYYFAGLDWADIHTAPGVYNFFSLDQFISLNQSRGTDILYTFGRTPQWASSQPNAVGSYGPGQCAPPADMAQWDNFVTAIATHAAGKIKYWELWNEPDSTPMYCGDIPTMVTMAKHASAILKKIDPNAVLLSPGVTGGPGPAWLATFLADGGASAVDAIGFHGYWSANAEDVLSVISSYKTAMQSNGAGAKPMWDTEASWAGFGNLGVPPTSQQVGFLAKSYLLHWSQGISRFIWFAFDAGATPWGNLSSTTGGQTPAAAAYSETYRWMVGASLTAPCSKNANGIWICDLTRPNGYQAEAVWIPNSSMAYNVHPKYKEYRDLAGVVHPVTGGQITAADQPVLLESGSLPQ